MTDLPLDPKALPPDAVRWLLGMGPDLDGYAFGENPDLGRGTGAFAWRRMIRRYLEAAPQPAAGDGWMPICDDARTGRAVLLYVPAGDNQVVGHWLRSEKKWAISLVDGRLHFLDADRPTKWRLLPAPPEGGA